MTDTIKYICSSGSCGTQTHMLNFPTALSFDEYSNMLYVCDNGNSRISIWYLNDHNRLTCFNAISSYKFVYNNNNNNSESHVDPVKINSRHKLQQKSEPNLPIQEYINNPFIILYDYINNILFAFTKDSNGLYQENDNDHYNDIDVNVLAFKFGWSKGDDDLDDDDNQDNNNNTGSGAGAGTGTSVHFGTIYHNKSIHHHQLRNLSNVCFVESINKINVNVKCRYQIASRLAFKCLSNLSMFPGQDQNSDINGENGYENEDGDGVGVDDDDDDDDDDGCNQDRTPFKNRMRYDGIILTAALDIVHRQIYIVNTNGNIHVITY